MGADGAVKDCLPAALQQQQLVEGLQKVFSMITFESLGLQAILESNTDA